DSRERRFLARSTRALAQPGSRQRRPHRHQTVADANVSTHESHDAQQCGTNSLTAPTPAPATTPAATEPAPAPNPHADRATHAPTTQPAKTHPTAATTAEAAQPPDPTPCRARARRAAR